ncbi:MAG: DNA topoisomerase VI subunit B [Thermoproteota archaeon]|nr:DNA topoisomerase VI subunit B [Thermoproteota archaeon]
MTLKQKATVEVAATQSKPAVLKGKVRYDKKAESEFFVDNSALAGFTTERILYMAVRELIENSLDSCETGHILPKISISLKLLDASNDLWMITCRDNGIGIPSDKVPIAVCSFLTSGKYVEKQQRGLFGVGLKMISAFSTKDTIHPLKVWSKSIEEGVEYHFALRTDISTNKPIVLAKKVAKGEESEITGDSGFKVEAVLHAKLSQITRNNIKNKINEYISQTSIVNPYAIIEYETDEGKVRFERRTEVMPQPAKEVLPHPADMDLQTLKKAIMSFMNQKTTLQGILSTSFQKMSSEKAKEIISKAGVENKSADRYTESELIEIVKVCKYINFQQANTDHLSPIGEQILTTGMTSEYTIITTRETASKEGSIAEIQRPHLTVKVLKPALTAYSSRTCVINNRPTIVECGIAYGGDIPSFKLYRFANKIPLLYDEGSDVAREVVSEVEINKMGITKKEAKAQFANGETKSDRAVELLPIHIFFHICSTKIPYKTAGKESIASEGELKKHMKYCLSELYRKVSAQIRKELRMKEAQGRLNLYKYYIPLVVSAISESIRVDAAKLEHSFAELAEKHVKGEITGGGLFDKKEDKITGERLEEEAEETLEIHGEAVKSDKDQQLMMTAGRRKSKLTKPLMKGKKIPETLRKDKRQNQVQQMTLDNVSDDNTKPKGRRSK